MPMTEYTRAALANSLFGLTSSFGALASAPSLYVGLSSTTPDSTGGNITEPSDVSYARVSTPYSSWNSATSADPSVVQNSAIITFPTATTDWSSGAVMTNLVLFDADTNGNCVGFTTLDSSTAVLSGQTASFAALALSINTA